MSEREQIEQEIRDLIADLSSTASQFGDWKNLKQIDENCYTELEMEAYRAGRAAIRARINELYEKLKELGDDKNN